VHDLPGTDDHGVRGFLFGCSWQASARRTFAIERATQLPLILRLAGARGDKSAE
jgi:hypothetical protein